MVFVGGWGRGSKVIGSGPYLKCNNCHNSNNYKIFETSRKATLYFIPVAKWDRQYWMVCPICNFGTELDSLEQAQKIVSETTASLPPLVMDEQGGLVEQFEDPAADRDDQDGDHPGKSAGVFYIAKIMEEAQENAIDFGETEIWMLMQNPQSVSEFLNTDPTIDEDDMRNSLAALNNLCVALIRSAIEREKATGAHCITVRAGLRIPSAWETNYQLMYETNLPWFVSTFAQNAFLGNPMDGEDGPWMSD